MDKATFAAGCFWGVEEQFRTVKGVISTTVGYTGGHTKNPTYEDVCSDTTGHVEAVQIEFDPNLISYNKLLKKFWDIHDPTTADRQGPDKGSQYQSVIFYHNKDQQLRAEQSKQRLERSGKYTKPIVTKIRKAMIFYPAEEYHQNYLMKINQSK